MTARGLFGVDAPGGAVVWPIWRLGFRSRANLLSGWVASSSPQLIGLRTERGEQGLDVPDERKEQTR
ncbi:hypothetical protein L1080_033425 [Rhodococcus sp. MSC1_016]|jgi:hypothetical protein|uniref:hypothetical protein n=1 Tax=Rhodococcus sp. MSC1_016 TaxID=2909266 RepID=UPI00202DC0A7|nr:hypothetical protein [Rhodococcus sp. MSC1_016]